jgi:hypothetical protein
METHAMLVYRQPLRDVGPRHTREEEESYQGGFLRDEK